MKVGARDALGRRFNVKPKNCRVCGKTFQPRNGAQYYCSPACLREKDLVKGTCEFCGRDFVKRKQVNPPRFCGLKCSSLATAKQRSQTLRAKTTPQPCERCGKPIPTANKKFCSRACHAATIRKGRMKDWSYRRDWGLSKKGEFDCRNCGCPASHLHHIVPRSKTRLGRSDPENNGIPLCSECHRGWHDRRVTIFRSRLRLNEVENAIKLAGEVWVENNYPYTPDQELRRRVAIANGEHPDEQWKYCLEGRTQDKAAVERAQEPVLEMLRELEASGGQW